MLFPLDNHSTCIVQPYVARILWDMPHFISEILKNCTFYSGFNNINNFYCFINFSVSKGCYEYQLVQFGVTVLIGAKVPALLPIIGFIPSVQMPTWWKQQMSWCYCENSFNTCQSPPTPKRVLKLPRRLWTTFREDTAFKLKSTWSK